MKTSLSVGTRCSPLALAQSYEVISILEKFYPHLKDKIAIKCIKTTGDAIADRSLTDVGGKSLFTKEIEVALLKDEIDIAVHSMKDVTADVPEGLIFPAILEREDPRDALVTFQKKPAEEFPAGTLFGTSSLRRQVYALQTYPHLSITLLRGNVATRLMKVEKGDVKVTLLAVSGLKRLGLLEKATKILSLEECLPAVAQGAIGIQCREDNTAIRELLFPLNHPPTFHAITAERAFMKVMQGSCRTPLAGYAYVEENTILFKGMISDSLGKNMRFVSSKGPLEEAIHIGEDAAENLRAQQCLTLL